MNATKTNLPLWCSRAAARMVVASEVVPIACHQNEVSFKSLITHTPKVFTVPASNLVGITRE